MDLATIIGSALRRHGCVSHGIAAAARFGEMELRLREAVAAGRSGGLGFTFARPEVAADVTTTFPWARRLVVAAHAYVPAAGTPAGGPSRGGRVARFATADHYLPLRRALEEVAGLLTARGWRAAVMVDDGRLVDRAAAIRAGIGWSGRSTLVLVPGAGPWVLLGSVVTDAELPVSAPMRRSCGTCRACLPACPTGAIIASGVLDARRCLAAVLQSPGWIPVDLRSAVGDRLYGCDDCLEACPPGERVLERSPATRPVDVIRWLSTGDRALRAAWPHFFVPRNEGRWLRRNALVVLGNVGGEAEVGILAGYLGHRDPMLRGHAAWALGRVGGSLGQAALTRVSEGDPDPRVRDEAEAALAGSLPS